MRGCLAQSRVLLSAVLLVAHEAPGRVRTVLHTGKVDGANGRRTVHKVPGSIFEEISSEGVGIGLLNFGHYLPPETSNEVSRG